MCDFAGSSGNKYLLGLRGRIWADFEVACEDENRSRIKNRRQVRRSVRSLLPAVRAVTGRFREFQSGVKIEGVISHLRSSSTRAYYHKKIIGVILDTEDLQAILLGLSQILCKHRNAVHIEQNLFKEEVAQAAAALFSK